MTMLSVCCFFEIRVPETEEDVAQRAAEPLSGCSVQLNTATWHSVQVGLH